VRRIESQLMLAEPASAYALQRSAVRLFERLLMERYANAALRRARDRPQEDSVLNRGTVAIWRRLPLSFRLHMPDTWMRGSAISTAPSPEPVVSCGIWCSSRLRHVLPFSLVPCNRCRNRVDGRGFAAGFVGDHVGHIACSAPHRARGEGLGSELLRQSATALHEGGAKRISLAVTAANEEAVGLYLRCGFRELHRFMPMCGSPRAEF